jgi:hypothetical protein
MSIETLRTTHTPARILYFTVWDDSFPPKVFDFNDSTFKPLSSPPTTPYLPATESTDMGGNLSVYIAQLDLELLNPSATEMRFQVQSLERKGAAPNLLTDSFTGGGELIVVEGVHSDTKVTLQPGAFDDIPVDDPGPPANHTTLDRMIVAIWRALYKMQTMNKEEYKRYADNGDVNATAGVSYDGETQTQGHFT